MNDVAILKSYALANASELQAELFDRRLITFNWLLGATPILDDLIFEADIGFRAEVCEFHNYKRELSRQRRWREWYLFFDCLSFRYESKFPGYYHIPAQCLMRSIGRELSRTEDKLIRQAAWRYIRTEFGLC